MKGIIKIFLSNPLFRVQTRFTTVYRVQTRFTTVYRVQTRFTTVYRVQTRFTTVYRINQKEDIIVFSLSLNDKYFLCINPQNNLAENQQLNIIKFQMEKQG